MVTDEEIVALWNIITEDSATHLSVGQMEFARGCINLILEKIGDPVAWRVFDGEGGYDYTTYFENEDLDKWYRERTDFYKTWCEKLYTIPQESDK